MEQLVKVARRVDANRDRLGAGGRHQPPEIGDRFGRMGDDHDPGAPITCGDLDGNSQALRSERQADRSAMLGRTGWDANSTGPVGCDWALTPARDERVEAERTNVVQALPGNTGSREHIGGGGAVYADSRRT